MHGSGVPLWKKALSQPEKVGAVWKMATTHGFSRTFSLIEEKKEASHPTGYSASGIVVALGSDVRDIAIGDRVACAGAQYAHHAEYIRVARNLCALIPDGVDFESASTVTLGAISLQGLRRAKPTLGETFVVLGLGIVATVQCLGQTVVGLSALILTLAYRQSLSLGMEHGVHPAMPKPTLWRV